MSEKIVTLNEEVIKGEIRELVRGSVEETLNNLLEAEADRLTQAARYERSEDRQGYRSGHYDRNLTTTSGEVTLPDTALLTLAATPLPIASALFKKFCKRDFCDEVRDIKIPEPEAVAS